MFKRRLGEGPHRNHDGGPSSSPGGRKCPDLFELDNGDIAVIGIRSTDLLRESLPNSAGCGPDEEIVIIPRHILLSAKNDIEGMK